MGVVENMKDVSDLVKQFNDVDLNRHTIFSAFPKAFQDLPIADYRTRGRVILVVRKLARENRD